MKTYLTITILLGLTIYSCCSINNRFGKKDLSNSNYKVDSLIESISKNDSIKIGVLSDIEGAIENAKSSASKLKLHHLNAIIIAGDCYENEIIRTDPLYPNSIDNVQEMIHGILPFAKLGIPIFVIAGNHETQSIFNDALIQLQRMNYEIIDINDKSVDFSGFNLIGLGGYHHPRFTAKNGFLITEMDYQRIKDDIDYFKQQNEPIIFVTHGPPKSDQLIDFIPNVGNVGDEKLTSIISSCNNITNIHGHIHEGGRNSAEFSGSISINVASITDYSNIKGPNVGIITIINKHVKHKFLN